MNTLKLLLTLFITLLILTGCPYESKVPLGSHQDHKINVELLGDWLFTDEDGEKQSITFKKQSDHEYLVTIADKDNPMNIRAYRTVIKGVNFLTFYEDKPLAEDERPYSFARYSLESGKLSVSIVEDSLFPEGDLTSQQLLKLLGESIGNPALYDTELVFER